jgi:hypothetical protein
MLSKLAQAPKLSFDCNTSIQSSNIWAMVNTTIRESNLDGVGQPPAVGEIAGSFPISFLLYSACMTYISDHIDFIFDPQRSSSFLQQDIISILVDSIGSLFLSQV